jgi:nucleoside 2-deoxyribosyltransferase
MNHNQQVVYLAGAINGLGDEEVFGWRRKAASALSGFEVIDPAARDFRGIEAGNEQEIVTRDLEDIDRAHVMLARAERPSWGTAMEIFYARGRGVRVVAFGAGQFPSPWLALHAELCPSLDAALALIGIA